GRRHVSPARAARAAVPRRDLDRLRWPHQGVVRAVGRAAADRSRLPRSPRLNVGIDFEGGAVFQVPSESLSVADARDALAPFGLAGSKVQELTSESGRAIRIQT